MVSQDLKKLVHETMEKAVIHAIDLHRARNINRKYFYHDGKFHYKKCGPYEYKFLRCGLIYRCFYVTYADIVCLLERNTNTKCSIEMKLSTICKKYGFSYEEFLDEFFRIVTGYDYFQLNESGLKVVYNDTIQNLLVVHKTGFLKENGYEE